MRKFILLSAYKGENKLMIAIDAIVCAHRDFVILEQTAERVIRQETFTRLKTADGDFLVDESPENIYYLINAETFS